MLQSNISLKSRIYRLCNSCTPVQFMPTAIHGVVKKHHRMFFYSPLKYITFFYFTVKDIYGKKKYKNYD